MLSPSAPGLWICFWGQPRGHKADREGDRRFSCTRAGALSEWHSHEQCPLRPGQGQPQGTELPQVPCSALWALLLSQRSQPHWGTEQGAFPPTPCTASLHGAHSPPDPAPWEQLIELQVTKGKVIELLSLVRFILIHKSSQKKKLTFKIQYHNGSKSALLVPYKIRH